MDNYRQDKVHKYEEFVDRRLKPDLVHAISERDKVFEQQKTFSDLRKNIENLQKNSVTSLRTLVNLGSEVYMQAEVPDTQRIFIDVGLGFHVEFTWSEALNYILLREEKLARQLEDYTHQIASIKAQIKLLKFGTLGVYQHGQYTKLGIPFFLARECWGFLEATSFPFLFAKENQNGTYLTVIRSCRAYHPYSRLPCLGNIYLQATVFAMMNQFVYFLIRSLD